MPQELKPLPNGCSKKELKNMFPNENHRDLMFIVNQVHAKKNKSRYKRYLSAAELSVILCEYTGLPVGYSDKFKDGECYKRKYATEKERFKL